MSLAVWDWRRRVSALYREVRDEPDARSAHGRWREGRDELLRDHPASPFAESERATFVRCRYAPYDPHLRFEVEVGAAGEPATYRTETGTDGVVEFSRLGRIGLGPLGDLDVWWLEGYGGGIFLPVADHHPDTYGGGRYVLDTVKGADLGGNFDAATGRGTLVVDLNFAYNPSCAYDPMWACPLAPPGNRIDAAVFAGELSSWDRT